MRGTVVTDTFTRTSASGWGTADTGQAWSTIGAGGTVNATDWSVGGTTAVHSVPAAIAYRASYLATFSQSFVDIAVTGSVAVTATGAPLELANLIARGTSITSYYLYRVQIETTQAVTAKIFDPAGAQLGSITVPGITYTANLQLRVRAQAVGKVFRMKVWPAANAEPAAWVLSVTDSTYTGAGFIGVRSGVASGNTNTLPLVFSYDNVSSVLLPDFPRDKLPLTVLAAFGADLSADPSTWPWTNITADVRAGSVSIRPGRPDETSQAPSASCSFDLLNKSKAYSAYNPNGPNYPNVKRNTPIWVIVDPATRFFGYANGFVPSWDTTGKQAIVSVSASGSLRRLMQGRTPLRSPLRRALAALTPLAHWALDDGSGATQAGSALTGGVPLAATGAVKFAQLDTPGGDKAPEIIGGRLTGTCPPGTSTTGFSVHFAARMVKSDPAATSKVWPLSVRTTDGRIWVWNILDAGGGASALVGEQSPPLPSASAATQVRAPLNFTPFDGQWHSFLMVATKVNSTTVLLDAYFDGRACQGTTVNGPVTFAPIGGQITIPEETWQPINQTASLSVDHVAIYDNPLDHVAAENLAAAVQGWAGETAGNRINRLCGEQGVAVPRTAPVTLVSEGFESSSLGITVTGTWARNNTQTHSGTWSYKSAAITDSQQTDAVVTVPAGATSMSVWYKVSSESGFDYFYILRDNAPDLRSSGEVGWTQRTLNVVGVNTVTFSYRKDSGTLAGSDAAWIDDIVFIKDNDLTAMLSTAKMGAQSVDTFVNLLRECEAADLGLLYDGFGPGLNYITRTARYNQSAALTLDVAAGQVDEPFAPADDDQRNRNLWKVSRRNGSSATAEDKTGPLGTNPLTGIGVYDSSTTVNVSTDAVLPDYASWLVHMGTVEGFRYPSLNLDLAASPELIDGWVAARLNSRIDVLNVDSKATGHAPGTVSLLDEGYTETLTPFGWKVAANCSPELPWRVFILDTDRLDADPSSKLVAGITSTATTFTVSTAAIAGALWTTDSAEWTAPKVLYLNVAGEQMQVTNITGAASPQTFTVIRSINGVIKAQKANAYVGLWQPRVLAL